MPNTLAIGNYRSLLKLVVPLGPLNVITGPNGSGKSNLYRALGLLGETAQGGVVNALAREGGLQSTFWAGPESLSRRMHKGDVAIQGGPRRGPVRLRLELKKALGQTQLVGQRLARCARLALAGLKGCRKRYQDRFDT